MRIHRSHTHSLPQLKLFQHCLNYYFDLFPHLCRGSGQEDISPTSSALLLLKFKHLEIWISLWKNLSRHQCLKQLTLVQYIHFSWDSEAWPAPIDVFEGADCLYWVCSAADSASLLSPFLLAHITSGESPSWKGWREIYPVSSSGLEEQTEIFTIPLLALCFQ